MRKCEAFDKVNADMSVSFSIQKFPIFALHLQGHEHFVPT